MSKIFFEHLVLRTFFLRNLPLLLIVGFISLFSGRAEALDQTAVLKKLDKIKACAIADGLHFENRENDPYGLENTNPSKYVNQILWAYVQDYLIPENHPAKLKLDEIFSISRALYDLQSMVQAGFEPAYPQHHSQIIVTRHPDLPGYVIKAYLDEQAYHSDKPEYYFWIKRIIGSRLIKNAIKAHEYDNFIKVPKKWIYLLPDEPAPPTGCLRKMFILVEEDMNIHSDKINEKLWRSPVVTKELLKALFIVITELGLFDCAKPANCPISKDGRIALIDTQSYYEKRVKYHKLTSYLSSPMRHYWLKLIKQLEANDEQ